MNDQDVERSIASTNLPRSVISSPSLASRTDLRISSDLDLL